MFWRRPMGTCAASFIARSGNPFSRRVLDGPPSQTLGAPLQTRRARRRAHHDTRRRHTHHRWPFTPRSPPPVPDRRTRTAVDSSIIRCLSRPAAPRHRRARAAAAGVGARAQARPRRRAPDRPHHLHPERPGRAIRRRAARAHRRGGPGGGPAAAPARLANAIR